MARLTNDGEPTYGAKIPGDTREAETRQSHHFSGVPAGQLSPAGDEPPLVQSRLSEDGAEIVDETLSPAGGIVSREVEPI